MAGSALGYRIVLVHWQPVGSAVMPVATVVVTVRSAGDTVAVDVSEHTERGRPAGF